MHSHPAGDWARQDPLHGRSILVFEKMGAKIFVNDRVEDRDVAITRPLISMHDLLGVSLKIYQYFCPVLNGDSK